MEEIRALLDAWIGKYIKQEVAFREGAALPSAAINDLFNILIAQGDDTTQTLKYACEYLLNFSDTHAQFIDDLQDRFEYTDTKVASKLDKSSLVNSDTINDPNKPASSAVTFALGQEIDAINNNFTDKNDKKYHIKLKNIGGRPYITYEEV